MRAKSKDKPRKLIKDTSKELKSEPKSTNKRSQKNFQIKQKSKIGAKKYR